jgi:hypothetical protein
LIEIPPVGAPDARAALHRSAAAYRKAIATSREADRTAAFHAMLGFVLTHLGERTEAEAAYAEAVRLEPDPATRDRYERALIEVRSSR